jgi:hypothetical protein
MTDKITSTILGVARQGSLYREGTTQKPLPTGTSNGYQVINRYLQQNRRCSFTSTTLHHCKTTPTTKSCNTTTCTHPSHTHKSQPLHFITCQENKTPKHTISGPRLSILEVQTHQAYFFPFAVALSRSKTPPGGMCGSIYTKNKHIVCQHSLFQTYCAVPGRGANKSQSQ